MQGDFCTIGGMICMQHLQPPLPAHAHNQSGSSLFELQYTNRLISIVITYSYGVSSDI